jgi:hypothetical protein
MVQRKIGDLTQKKERILETFFEGVIDRQRRDAALESVERELATYQEILRSASVPREERFDDVNSALRLLEPFADWEFLAREDRRAILRQLCPEISVYQYKVKSLTLNLGSTTGVPRDRDDLNHSKMDVSRSRAPLFP